MSYFQNIQLREVSHVHKLQTFFMKSLSGTMVSSSGAGLATDTRKTLMPDSLASVAACSRSSDGQPSISTIMTRGWARLAPFSWVKKVSTVCMMALPARGHDKRAVANRSQLLAIVHKLQRISLTPGALATVGNISNIKMSAILQWVIFLIMWYFKCSSDSRCSPALGGILKQLH